MSGWIKLYAATDPDTSCILAYVVTDESCGAVNIFGLLVENVISAGHRVGKILADAAYDKKGCWNEYTGKSIDVAINIKSPQLNKNVPD